MQNALNARDVPARLGKALRQTSIYRIAADHGHDWNFLGDTMRYGRSGLRDRDDHIYR